MNSFQNSPSLSNHITSIIVRLRGPDGIINKENEKENKKKSKSPFPNNKIYLNSNINFFKNEIDKSFFTNIFQFIYFLNKLFNL